MAVTDRIAYRKEFPMPFSTFARRSAVVVPNYKKLFQPLHEAGKLILYTSDGNYTHFIDDIADCGVNVFVMEPCTDSSSRNARMSAMRLRSSSQLTFST